MKLLRTKGYQGKPLALNAANIDALRPLMPDAEGPRSGITMSRTIDAESEWIVRESYESIIKKLEAL